MTMQFVFPDSRTDARPRVHLYTWAPLPLFVSADIPSSHYIISLENRVIARGPNGREHRFGPVAFPFLAAALCTSSWVTPDDVAVTYAHSPDDIKDYDSWDVWMIGQRYYTTLRNLGLALTRLRRGAQSYRLEPLP